jgi:glycine cleavage system H lipoate-binding protein
MEPLMTFLSSVGIFIVGIIIRLLIFAAIVLILAVPIMFVLGGVEAFAKLRRWAAGVTKVGTMFFRPGVYYAPGHTWVESATRKGVRVGLDDLAQRLLAGPLRMNLPAIGSRVRQGLPVATVRIDDHETPILSPVTGTVTAVNSRVRRDPSLLHRDPYRRGWLLQVSPSEPGYLKLRRDEAARLWFSEEGVRLERTLQLELGYAVADGGDLVMPAHKMLHSAQWQRVVDSFLGQS